MIDFLAGALTLAYVIAAVYFVHFWQRTSTGSSSRSPPRSRCSR